MEGRLSSEGHGEAWKELELRPSEDDQDQCPDMTKVIKRVSPGAFQVGELFVN
jgi:hypothetical protein